MLEEKPLPELIRDLAFHEAAAHHIREIGYEHVAVNLEKKAAKLREEIVAKEKAREE